MEWNYKVIKWLYDYSHDENERRLKSRMRPGPMRLSGQTEMEQNNRLVEKQKIHHLRYHFLH